MYNISFFSYKGGAGRTTLSFNTMSYLIQKLKPTAENPIILIDLDIDSKGISFLLDRISAVNTIQVLKNEIEVEACDPAKIPISNHPFFKSLAQVGSAFGLDEKDDGAVLFISAKATNGDNNYLNNTNNFDGAGIGLGGLSELCERYNCKALVMDTPAGEQLASDAAISISDVVVTVLRITKQFRQGTFEYLKTRSKRYEGKKFIIVPNAVPKIDGINSNIISNIFSKMQSALDSLSNANIINHYFIQEERGINEIQLFKINEVNLYNESKFRELTNDEKEAIVKFNKLAELILKNE